MNRKIYVFLPVLFFLVLSACATKKEMYYWGEYEPLIYSMYKKPGTAEPIEQIEKLSSDIQKAADSGKKVPPGIYAHLAVMYAAQGNAAESHEAFEKEKTLYPESVYFIDGMLKRAASNGAKQ